MFDPAHADRRSPAPTVRKRRHASVGLLLVCACWLLAEAAAAQDGARAFAIPPKSIDAAMVDFAVQGRISVVKTAGTSCHGITRPLAGRFRPRDALDRLLAGSGCHAEAIDLTSFRIVMTRPAPPRAATSVRHPASPPSPSPPQSSVPPTLFEEVVVTATRRPMRLDRSPNAIGVVGADELRDGGVSDDAQLESRLAGVTVTNLGAGRDKILIRGLSDGPLTGRTQSTVGIYLDDVRVTYNAPDPDLRLTDVERVEVLRGPQGSLYGAGSIGGIVHVVTRPPQFEIFSADISFTGSSTRDGAPSGVVEGAVNIPIGDRMAVRAVAYAEQAGGYFDNVRTGQDDTNRTRRNGGRIAARIQIDPDWTATLGLVRQTIDSRDAQYGDARLGPFERSNRALEPHDNDFTAAYVGVEGAGRLGRLTASTGLVFHEISSTYDASTALPLFSPLPPAPTAFDQVDTVKMLVNEVAMTSNRDGRLQWLAGAFYSHGEQIGLSLLQTDPMIVPYREDRTDLLQEAAVYGDASYAPWPRLLLSVGGRAFWSSVSTSSEIVQPLVGGRADFRGRTATSGFAPKLVASWRAGDDLLLYVQAAEGYRSGGFNTSGLVGQAFGSQGSGAEPYRRYGGDELWNYEAGAKVALLKSRLRLRAAAFSSVWTDIQSDQLLPSGLPFTANIGDGHVTGLEAEGSLAVGVLTLRGNLLIDHSELVRPNPAFPARADSSLPGAPAVSFGFGGTVHRPLSETVTAVVDADVSYVGPSTLTFDAATAPRMGDYSTIRVSAGLETDHWRVVAFVDNLADNRGDTFAYGNPFTLRLFGQSTPQRPRTVGLSFSRSF